MPGAAPLVRGSLGALVSSLQGEGSFSGSWCVPVRRTMAIPPCRRGGSGQGAKGEDLLLQSASDPQTRYQKGCERLAVVFMALEDHRRMDLARGTRTYQFS